MAVTDCLSTNEDVYYTLSGSLEVYEYDETGAKASNGVKATTTTEINKVALKKILYVWNNNLKLYFPEKMVGGSKMIKSINLVENTVLVVTSKMHHHLL